MRGPIDFQTVFDRIPSPYMMLDRELRFVAANHAYLAAVGRDWGQLEGVGMFEAFPSGGESRRLLESSLVRARDSGHVDMLPLIHYAIQRPQALGGGFEDRIWSATHTPIGGENGETLYILQHTQDVTEIQRLKDVAFGGRALPAAMMLGDDLLRRAETVQAQSLQLRQLFMQAPGFMAVMRGPDHIFELVNNTYLQLIGHRDVVGQPIREALPEVVEQGFVALLDNVRRTGEAFVGRQVKVIMQRDRGGAPYERYLDFIYQPIIEDDGEISGIFLEGADVTDQVRAQERQRLLVDELNHRVKNTLATVQAIAQQTLRGSDTPKHFAEAFEARLMALSQTHNALTDSHWTGAGLRHILWQELSPYGAERVMMHGPDVQLSARLALALGMVFHELATNAAKYGALSDGGRLAVIWSVDGSDDLSLEWRETGGPPASPPSKRGFGSRLIERSITGELQGRIQLDYATTGLVCRFTVPLAREA
jgi:two-component sensor histidine kinase